MAAASLVTFARELYQRTRCRIVGVLFDPRWNCASQRGVVKMSRFQVPLVVTRCLNYFAMNLGRDANHAAAKEFHEKFHENNSEMRHDRGFGFVVYGSENLGA